MSSDEVSAHNGDGATSTHRTVDEDACIRARAQRARDVARRAREVGRELRERRVMQRNLRCVGGQRRGQRDVARHHG